MVNPFFSLAQAFRSGTSRRRQARFRASARPGGLQPLNATT
jgi:hypothetical protein